MTIQNFPRIFLDPPLSRNYSNEVLECLVNPINGAINDPLVFFIPFSAHVVCSLSQSNAVDEEIAIGEQLQCINIKVWSPDGSSDAVTPAEPVLASVTSSK